MKEFKIRVGKTEESDSVYQVVLDNAIVALTPYAEDAYLVGASIYVAATQLPKELDKWAKIIEEMDKHDGEITVNA